MRAIALIVAALFVAAPAAAENMSHVHIGHVMSGWGDTPGGKGLLPTAQAEAKVAMAHIEFALANPGDMGAIRLHTAHVLHAVDPESEPSGPGKGYGLIKAAKGARTHVAAAAQSDDASDNVRLHAEHVGASLANVVGWGEEIVMLARRVKAAYGAEEAAPLARHILTLLTCVTKGCDFDGDGEISWGPAEGGLAQAAQHMGFMMTGEGLN